MIEAFRTHQPALWREIERITPDLGNAAAQYARVQPISLDYAVMEKHARQACVAVRHGVE